MADTTTLFEPTVSKSLAHGNFMPETSSQLATQQDTPSMGESMIHVIARAASDVTVDVSKMQELVALQRELMGIQVEQAFNASLAELQTKLPRVKKSGEVDFTSSKGRTHYKYAKYEHVDTAIRPLLSAHGFSLSFNCDGNLYIGKLSHARGHFSTAQIKLNADNSGNKNEIQAIGSALTYAKRILVGMLLNIVTEDEDDDAQSFGSINEAELKEIKELVSKANPDMGKFLEYLGCASLEDIPKSAFKKAKSALNDRIKNIRNSQPINLTKKAN